MTPRSRARSGYGARCQRSRQARSRAERTMAEAKHVDAFPFGYGAKGGYSPMTTIKLYTAPPKSRLHEGLCGQSVLVHSAYRCSECSVMTKPRCLAILFWRFSISAS